MGGLNIAFFYVCDQIILTHICLIDFPILINWTSPFQFKGCQVHFCHVESIFSRHSCKQTVKTLIRRDLGLQCLRMSQKWFIRVNQMLQTEPFLSVVMNEITCMVTVLLRSIFCNILEPEQ